MQKTACAFFMLLCNKLSYLLIINSQFITYFLLSVLAETDPMGVDAVLLHVGTNHLQSICDDIRQLDKTLDQHRRLIADTQARDVPRSASCCVCSTPPL